MPETTALTKPNAGAALPAAVPPACSRAGGRLPPQPLSPAAPQPLSSSAPQPLSPSPPRSSGTAAIPLPGACPGSPAQPRAQPGPGGAEAGAGAGAGPVQVAEGREEPAAGWGWEGAAGRALKPENKNK